MTFHVLLGIWSLDILVKHGGSESKTSNENSQAILARTVVEAKCLNNQQPVLVSEGVICYWHRVRCVSVRVSTPFNSGRRCELRLPEKPRVPRVELGGGDCYFCDICQPHRKPTSYQWPCWRSQHPHLQPALVHCLAEKKCQHHS